MDKYIFNENNGLRYELQRRLQQWKKQSSGKYQ